MNIEYTQLAVALGINGAIAGKEYRAKCPLHDDRSPSFSMNIDTGLWICHRGCGSGQFQQLVERTLNCSQTEAWDWITHNGVASSVELISQRLATALNSPSDPEYIPDNLGWLIRYNMLGNAAMPIWFMNRGFTWDTVNSWGLKYDQIWDAVIIPVYHQDKLVGTITRHTKPQFPKYQNSPNMPRSQMLFGKYDISQSSIILTEGALDVMWLWQNGYNAAALLGTDLSQEQVHILQQNRYGEIVLALDNPNIDEAGRIGTKKAIEKLTKAGWMLPQITILGYPDDVKDVQDCSPGLLADIYGHRKDYMNDIFARNERAHVPVDGRKATG